MPWNNNERGLKLESFKNDAKSPLKVHKKSSYDTKVSHMQFIPSNTIVSVRKTPELKTLFTEIHIHVEVPMSLLWEIDSELVLVSDLVYLVGKTWMISSQNILSWPLDSNHSRDSMNSMGERSSENNDEFTLWISVFSQVHLIDFWFLDLPLACLVGDF